MSSILENKRLREFLERRSPSRKVGVRDFLGAIFGSFLPNFIKAADVALLNAKERKRNEIVTDAKFKIEEATAEYESPLFKTHRANYARYINPLEKDAFINEQAKKLARNNTEFNKFLEAGIGPDPDKYKGKDRVEYDNLVNSLKPEVIKTYEAFKNDKRVTAPTAAMFTREESEQLVAELKQLDANPKYRGIIPYFFSSANSKFGPGAKEKISLMKKSKDKEEKSNKISEESATIPDASNIEGITKTKNDTYIVDKSKLGTTDSVLGTEKGRKILNDSMKEIGNTYAEIFRGGDNSTDIFSNKQFTLKKPDGTGDTFKTSSTNVFSLDKLESSDVTIMLGDEKVTDETLKVLYLGEYVREAAGMLKANDLVKNQVAKSDEAYIEKSLELLSKSNVIVDNVGIMGGVETTIILPQAVKNKVPPQESDITTENEDTEETTTTEMSAEVIVNNYISSDKFSNLTNEQKIKGIKESIEILKSEENPRTDLIKQFELQIPKFSPMSEADALYEAGDFYDEASVKTDGRRPFPSPEFYSSVASNVVDFLRVDTDEKIAKLTETINELEDGKNPIIPYLPQINNFAEEIAGERINVRRLDREEKISYLTQYINLLNNPSLASNL